MRIEIQKIKDVKSPKYAHDGDAGIDLYSAEETTLEPNVTKIVPTGIKIAIPQNHVGLIWDRSGLAIKHELHCLAGVIDSGYRGEVGIVITNLSKKPFVVEKNTRIAQMLIQPVIQGKIEEVDVLDSTKRSENGFGSSGLK